MNKAAALAPSLQLLPIAVGHYRHPGWPDLDTETEAGKVTDLLASFGGSTDRWAAPAFERGASAVQQRLREWADSAALAGTSLSTVLYWAGHGWSDGRSAVLAHRDTPNPAGAYGVTPEEFAYAVRDRQAALQSRIGNASTDGQGWAMVVIDACRSKRFAELVTAILQQHDLPYGVLLIGTSGDGATTLGRFTAALRRALNATYQANRQIPLEDLGNQLRRLLPGCAVSLLGDLTDARLIPLFPPVASWMSAPLADIRHLEEVLGDLSVDERWHFLAKAQGSEQQELSWFFEGRGKEFAQMSTWLHKVRTGMLIVTGRAGSGKSALLGNVLVQSMPVLRDALARRGLLTAPRIGAVTPPDSVFDAVIHLSGLDLGQAAMRVATAAGIGPLPSQRDPEAGIASDLDFIADELARRATRFTVLADALDESLDPLDTGRSLMARIAALPGVRIVIGTRASTNEAPDSPAADENLLGALSAIAAGSGYSGDGPDNEAADGCLLVRVGQEQDAIRRYVTGRLRAARDYGVADRTIPFMTEVSDNDIDRAAAEIADRQQEFLFARLAVYELIADPRLLIPGMARSRSQMLSGTHQDLFGRALHRLGDHDDRYPVLMRALSLARGRGVPEADGIWATMAAALIAAPVARPATKPGRDYGTRPAADLVSTATESWAEAISGLLHHAAAYIAIDAESAPGERTEPRTVYRLAHRTFIEFFGRHPATAGTADDPRRLAAAALLRTAARLAVSGPGGLPTYLARHLSGHAAEAGMWDGLADQFRVLDGLDPRAVTADAIRTLFGRRAVPPPVAGVIGARDILTVSAPADRAGIRHLSTTIHSTQHVIGEPAAGWGIAAAQAGQATVHVRLSGHTSAVCCVRSFALHDGRTILASASDDGTIRLWDPYTALPVGARLTGSGGTVEEICVFPGTDGQPFLAGAGQDGTIRLWDPATGRTVGDPLTGHTGTVWGLCTVPGPGSHALLASAGDDGTVRLWNPATRRTVGQPLTGHTGRVLSVCTVPGPDGRAVLASAGDDGTVRLWDPATRQQTTDPLTGHTGRVLSMCTVPGPDGQALLVSAGQDGTVRIWDPAIGHQAGDSLTGYIGRVLSACAFSGPDGHAFLASAGQDELIHIWDPAAGQSAGSPLTGHTGIIYGLCAFRGADGHALLASAGGDGTIRIWDPATGRAVDEPLTGHASRVLGVCALPGAGGQTLLASAGDDGTIRTWDPAIGQQTGTPFTGHTGTIYGLCALPDPDGHAQLVSAGGDGTIRIWDPATGRAVGEPLTGHAGRIWGVCVLPGQDGSSLLASAGEDATVRIWEPASGQPMGNPLTGHTGPVQGVCPVTGPDGQVLLASAGQDGTIRLWDPIARHAVGEPLTELSATVSSLDEYASNEADCVTVNGNGTVHTWTAATSSLRTVPSHAHACAAVTIAMQRRVVLIEGDTAGQVHVSDLTADRDRHYAISVSHHAVLALRPLPGYPPRLAAASGNGVLSVLTLTRTGLSVGPVRQRCHQGPVRVLCLIEHPVGSPLLASAGNDATICVWDLSTAEANDSGSEPSPTQMTGHDGWIWSLAAVPAQFGSPPLLASAGADHTVRLWNPISGHPFGKPLTGHTDQVRAVTTAVSDDGRVVLISGGHDGTVRLWNPVTGAPGAVIPLGIPVHALFFRRPDRASRERTDSGATITVGLRTGILALDINRNLFPAAPATA